MSRPKCPNHGCEMQGTDERRIYICPISGADFECDVEDQQAEKKFDKFGQPKVEWVIKGDD